MRIHPTPPVADLALVYAVTDPGKGFGGITAGGGARFGGPATPVRWIPL